MGEFVIQWWLAAVFGLILGYIISAIKAKARINRTMIDCTNNRLDTMETEIREIKNVQFKAQRREIINTYRFYKSRKKIPVYEMEEVEDIYKEYSKVDDNGIIKQFMEQMRTWTTSEEGKL